MAKYLPSVGDVITSQKFVYGYYENEERKAVTIDGKTTERNVPCSISEDERVAIAAKTGEIPPKKRIMELGAHDPSRASAKFVVESAKMEGGGGGHGGETYPDGWHVRARRLNEDGTYNPNGEAIRFYMTSGFTCLVEPEHVQIVGEMQMQFV